jgi:hypothetical protein
MSSLSVISLQIESHLSDSSFIVQRSACRLLPLSFRGFQDNKIKTIHDGGEWLNYWRSSAGIFPPRERRYGTRYWRLAAAAAFAERVNIR